MIFGKYGNMILTNMEKNYPYRKQELELTGELNLKIFEREKYILKLKEQVKKQIKENIKLLIHTKYPYLLNIKK